MSSGKPVQPNALQWIDYVSFDRLQCPADDHDQTPVWGLGDGDQQGQEAGDRLAGGDRTGPEGDLGGGHRLMHRQDLLGA